MTKLIDKDADAYAQVEKALSMPKTTEAEKTERKMKLQKALKIAAEIPLETSRLTKNTLSIILKNENSISPVTTSDIKMAETLCRAAIEGAIATASMNIPINK